jgi:hypothetical protein
MLKATSSVSPAPHFGERQAEPSVPFGYETVFARDDEPSHNEDQQDRLLKVLDVLCEWLYPARSRKSTMTLRAYVFIWYLRPEWLGNPSQVELAKRLKISKQSLGKVVSQMRRRFGFYVAGMRHEEARAKFAAHAKAKAPVLAEARRQATKTRIAGQQGVVIASMAHTTPR